MKDYEIKDGKIIRYVPIDISEGFAMLADNLDPLVGLRNHTSRPWLKLILSYIIPKAEGAYIDEDGDEWKLCARIVEIDPRAVPEGVAELPEPWLAFVDKDTIRERGLDRHSDRAIWFCDGVVWDQISDDVVEFYLFSEEEYSIDVRTEFARKHFPEYVEAVGYVEDRYGYLTNGEPVPAPPEGWEIVPEGERLPEDYIPFTRGRWKKPVTGCKLEQLARTYKDLRAYARRVSPIASANDDSELLEWMIEKWNKNHLRKMTREHIRERIRAAMKGGAK